MQETTFIVEKQIASGWFNGDLTRFAIVPTASEDPEITAEIVDRLVRSYAESDESEELDEILAELIDLHARGLVLWPMGVLWGRSPLGELFGQRFSRIVKTEDPLSFEIREQILQSAQFQESEWRDTEKNNRSFIFWRLYMTVRLAAANIHKLDDLQEAHLLQMFELLKPNGVWLDWVPIWTKKNLLYFADFLGEQRQQPMFAVGQFNPARALSLPLRRQKISVTHPHLAWVEQAFESWADELPTMTKNGPRDAKRLFLEFLKTVPAEKIDLKLVFSKESMSKLLTFAATWSTPTSRVNALPKILEFSQWYAAFASKIVKIEVGLSSYDVAQFVKKVPLPQRNGEVHARPMPARFHHMLKEIISENDFAWVKGLKHGGTGKPVHWITWVNPQTGKSEPVFCEVLPRMLLLHLDLPLRNVQIRRLDSGEGDERCYDATSKTWERARGPHVGYWKRVGAANPRRGVFREITTMTGTLTGLWINSNKTQDSRNLFDERSGYEIPWQHDEVLVNLAAMRAWQEKYNPVAAPLSHAALPAGVFDDDPSEVVRAVLPDRFYLFRYPQNAAPRGNEAPPSYFVFLQFFHDALDELEKRLAKDDPTAAVRIITERDRSGQPRKAIFTIHGMRSSTLTSLHMAGVPIEVLSKIVAGHATILMTLRYTKFDPAHINEMLNAARMNAVAAGRDHFANFLKSASLQEAMRMTARLADDGVRQIKGSYDEPTGWVRLETGICPNGATQCHTGGPALAKRTDKGRDKSYYSPVPGGARNCVRCRFFVTGLPFLIPLWAHASAIVAKVDSLSSRISETQRELEVLKKERAAGITSQVTVDRIRVLDETWIGASEARDNALADLHATLVLIEKIRVIAAPGEGASDKLPMLLSSDAVPEIAARESTRFELVDAVVQASRWFPSMDTADLERERDEFLNRILYRNGYVPITLAPLTVQERRRAADALAQMLIVELGATEAQKLIDGRKSLADVGLQERLEQAATRAIGHPMERLSLSGPVITLASSSVAAE